MTDSPGRPGRAGRPVLEIDHVTAGYGDTVVLRDVPSAWPTPRWWRCWGRTVPARRPCSHGGGLHPSQERRHQIRRGGRDQRRRPRDGPQGALPPSRGPGHLPLPHRAGQPDPAVTQATGAGQHRAGGGGVPRSSGRGSGRRREASVAVSSRCWPSCAPTCPIRNRGRGRGLPRAGSPHGGPDLRHVAPDRGDRHVVAAGRAVRDPCPGTGGSRAYLLNRGQVVFSGAADDLEGDDVYERYLGIEVGP